MQASGSQFGSHGNGLLKSARQVLNGVSGDVFTRFLRPVCCPVRSVQFVMGLITGDSSPFFHFPVIWYAGCTRGNGAQKWGRCAVVRSSAQSEGGCAPQSAHSERMEARPSNFLPIDYFFFLYFNALKSWCMCAYLNRNLLFFCS